MPRSWLPVAFAVLPAAALLAALLAGACGGTGGAAVPNPEGEPLPPPQNVVSGTGTVRYVELEGGFYGLVDDDSTRYIPQNLSEAYRRDSLRVRFRAVTQDSMATMQMWGTPIEILDILRLNDQ